MAFIDWIKTSREWIQEGGIQGVKYSTHQLRLGIIRRLSPFFDEGVNVYEKDWDLLIVLDGCRVDAIEEIADEYAFLHDPGTHRSTASTTWEWIETTFTREHIDEIGNTVYVTANQHGERIADELLLAFEDVYNYGWDDKINTVPADVVTDVAIETGRKYSESRERMIVHYLQPHFPSVPEPLGHGAKFDNVWKKLMIGGIDESEVWRSYIANLRYVLDSVEVLLDNIDADTVVISADHGNAKGEWGVYEHPHGIPLGCLKEVPWYTTTAADKETRSPAVSKRSDELDQDEIDQRLQALGYRT